MQNVKPEQDFLLLIREAGLASMAIGEGLTFLRKNNFTKHPYALYSFFSLTTGLERLLKLILIYEYRKVNSDFPKNNYLKKYSHNLIDLFEKAKQIANSIGCVETYSDVNNKICTNILILLNEFAKSSRYYNLDMLSGHSQQYDEPLKRWNELVNNEIISLHYKVPKGLDEIDDAIESVHTNITVLHYDYSGNEINSLGKLVKAGRTFEVCSKYSMLYCYKIVRFLATLLKKLESSENQPFISEYFAHLRLADDKYVLKRKTWHLYGI